ncbi:MAG: ALOG family protein [bacterium]|nr:ALOG family protein [bacterium]
MARFKQNKPYQRQKNSLQQQLESFLWSLPTRKTLATASPNDVVDFLIWRDKFGKTESHLDSCPGSSQNQEPCACQRGLAAGTIKNNIGKLSTIFKDNGRGSIWNDDLHLGNPANHPSVREYYS